MGFGVWLSRDAQRRSSQRRLIINYQLSFPHSLPSYDTHFLSKPTPPLVKVLKLHPTISPQPSLLATAPAAPRDRDLAHYHSTPPCMKLTLVWSPVSCAVSFRPRCLPLSQSAFPAMLSSIHPSIITLHRLNLRRSPYKWHQSSRPYASCVVIFYPA